MGFFDLFEDNCLPGDPSFDDLYGGNQSGMFPDEEHFIIDVSAGVFGIGSAALLCQLYGYNNANAMVKIEPTLRKCIAFF